METLCYANIAMKLLEGNLLVQIPPIWDKHMFEGSLEVKLPTIWRDEKQSREEA